MVDETLLMVPDIAMRLRVHPEAVQRWPRAGELRDMRKPDSIAWCIPATEFQRFIVEALGGPVSITSEEVR